MKLWLTALSRFSSLQPAAAVSLSALVQLTKTGFCGNRIVDALRKTEAGISCRPRHDGGRCLRQTTALKGEHA